MSPDFDYYSDDSFELDDDGRIEVNIEELATLVKAIMDRNVKITTQLLENNISLTACADATNRTLLMYAAYSGANPIVKLFLDHNLIPPTVEDDNGLTAFDWAVLGGNPVASRMISRWLQNNNAWDE
tara:strand:- start:1253 stop:1633 length:381 start_codon:yes stop_codon:yes gene_type:complete